MTRDGKVLLKVIILGDSGVGKTSIMKRFHSQKFSRQYKTTIGADFATKEIEIDGHRVTLQIWDTAGQERFHSLGIAFYRGADACFLVYDITKPRTFENLSNWQDEFISHATPQNPEDFPFAVLGNMVDKAKDRRVPEHEARRYCSRDPEHEMMYFETSALDNIGIDEAFYALAEAAIKQSKQEELFVPNTVKFGLQDEKSSSDQCPC